MRYKLIVNPAAGKGKAGTLVPPLKELLERAGISHEVEFTEREGHATQIARKASAEEWTAVVAVGGDGTANEVIAGLAGSNMPLAVIPAGTGNDLVRSLQLPKTLEEVAKTLANPRIVEMDIGEDQGNFFACICGMGFAADVMHNVNLSKGIFRGSSAIAWGIIKTLRELGEIPITLELDGVAKQEKVQAVFILNTVYAGGGLKLSPEADYRDRMLDVLVMRDMSRFEVMTVLPKVYKGTHLSHPKVDFYRVKEVKVISEEPVRKMFDGNVSGLTPISARVFPYLLKVIVPPEHSLGKELELKGCI